jgi:hypothetical protein
MIMIENKINTPKYFPNTIAVLLIGAVIRSSIVPVNFSSENSRMEMIGTRKISMKSITRKSLLKDAYRF